MEGKKDNIDPNRNLHADRHYHCAKAYYLIDENNFNNSPYIYCPGSNIMNEKRIEIENELSKNKVLKNENFYVNEDHLKTLNIYEKPIIVSPNSLVISDNIGFHKRGEMHHGFSRKQIRISFHGLQANFIQKSIRNILRKYSKNENLSNS